MRDSERALVEEEEKAIEMADLKYIDDVKALDNTISKVEGRDLYPKILLLQGMISMFACSYNMYSLSFLNSLPKFHCPLGPGGSMKYVPEIEACPIIDQCTVEYFYEGWVKQYSMLCDNRSSRVFYVSLIFVINASVFFGLSTIADIFGRNLILKLSTVIATLGTFLIYMVDNYGLKIIIFGVVTGTNSIFQMMFTLGLKEAMPSTTDYNVYMNAILNCAYNIGPVFVAILAIFLTNYERLSLVGSLIVAVGTFGNFFLYNETPLFLYKKKKGKEFINKLFLLSKINSVTTSKKSILRQLITDEIEYRKKQKLIIPETGVKRTVLDGDDDEIGHGKSFHSKWSAKPNSQGNRDSFMSETKKKESLEGMPAQELQNLEPTTGVASQQKPLRELKLKDLRRATKFEITAPQSQAQAESKTPDVNLVWVTIVLCYWCSSLYLVNYGTVISMDKSGMDNLYVNMVLLGVASFIGYGVCLKFPKDVPRIKTISLIILGLLAMSMIILLLDRFAGSSGTVNFLKSLCTVFFMPILVGMGFSVMYLYLPDVYPVTLRGLGIGAVICMGKIFGGACSAYIANFMNQLSLNPIAGCALPGVVLLFLLRTVPGT
jgi:Major Facilitator Superfamily